jgi:arginine repressor
MKKSQLTGIVKEIVISMNAQKPELDFELISDEKVVNTASNIVRDLVEAGIVKAPSKIGGGVASQKAEQIINHYLKSMVNNIAMNVYDSKLVRMSVAEQKR